MILGWLKTKGIFCWRNNSTGLWDDKRKIFRKNTGLGHMNGVADILGVLPDGRFLAIEAKSKTGKLSPEQIEFIATVNKHGGFAFVANSLETVKEQLNENC